MSRSILVALVLANVAVGVYFSTLSPKAEQSGTVELAAARAADTPVATSTAQSVEITNVSAVPEMPEPVLQAVDDESVESMNSLDAAVPETPDEVEIASAEMVRQPVRECRVWGPVADPGEFDGLSAALSRTGGLPEIQEMDVQIAPDYLVFVTGMPSLSHARETAAALREMKIDNYVINREESGAGVAVGVFSRRELAERQRQKVSGFGYEVAIAPMQKSQKAYNLVAHVTSESEYYASSISACLDIAHNP